MHTAAFLLRRAAAAQSQTPTNHLHRLLRRGVKTEARLAELGVTLPPPGVPKGNFVMAARSGKMIYLCTCVSLVLECGGGGSIVVD